MSFDTPTPEQLEAMAQRLKESNERAKAAKEQAKRDKFQKELAAEKARRGDA